jgi:hypothetical protein
MIGNPLEEGGTHGNQSVKIRCTIDDLACRSLASWLDADPVVHDSLFFVHPL